MNVRQISEVVLQVGANTVALMPALIFAISVPMAQRQRVVIATNGHQLSICDAWSSILIGMFFNQVLPTSIGGDVVRGVNAELCGKVGDDGVR